MKRYANGYISNRVLKLNVGFLLAAGPGHSHETVFDVPAVRVSDDLDLAYIRGPVRLSRTKEGILVQEQLEVALNEECSRCLENVFTQLTIDLAELFSYPVAAGAEFSVSDDGILDLAPLIRAEVLIAISGGVLCRPDCKGLCPDCGANLNLTSCSCADEQIDPRMAKLKELLDASK
ncbi:MAG: DUF177 domain-containing protein [Chloroflexota bacterium]